MEKEEYTEPIYSFNILVPIKFSISGTPSFNKKLERYCKKNKTTKTEFSNKLLGEELRINGIKSFEQLAKDSGVFNQMSDSFKQSLNEFLGTSNISRFLKERIERRWENEKFE